MNQITQTQLLNMTLEPIARRFKIWRLEGQIKNLNAHIDNEQKGIEASFVVIQVLSTEVINLRHQRLVLQGASKPVKIYTERRGSRIKRAFFGMFGIRRKS